MSKSRIVIASIVIVTGLLTSTSKAIGNVAHTSYFTFSGRIALPGVSLPAGTYVFEVVNPTANAIVRVSSRDGRKTYVTAFTRTIDRSPGQPADLQLVLNEVPAGTRPSVRAWFPLGERSGHEFIYPSPDAKR